MIEILGRKYITSKEASITYGHSKSWLDKLRAKKNSPPYIQINGRGKVYYDVSKLEKWFLNSEVKKGE